LLVTQYSGRVKDKTIFSDHKEGNGNQVIPERKHNERIVSVQGETQTLFGPMRGRIPLDNIRVAQYIMPHANIPAVFSLRNISGSFLRGCTTGGSSRRAQLSKYISGSCSLKNNVSFLSNVCCSSDLNSKGNICGSTALPSYVISET
jgi:hypothetical protein